MPFQKGNKLAVGHLKPKQILWDDVGQYIVTYGATEFLRIVMSWAKDKETEKEFVGTYLNALEYFKPKLARVELKNPDGETFNLKIDL